MHQNFTWGEQIERKFSRILFSLEFWDQSTLGGSPKIPENQNNWKLLFYSSHGISKFQTRIFGQMENTLKVLSLGFRSLGQTQQFTSDAVSFLIWEYKSHFL